MQMKFITGFIIAFLLFTSVAKSQVLPANWHQQTIGQTQVAGTGTWSNDKFTVSGSGLDIWGKTEEYHYVYTNAADSIEVIAKIENVENTSDWAKAGIMIKQNPLSSSALAVLSFSPNKSLVFAIRKNDGEIITGEQGIQKGQNWLKLIYKRNVVAAYSSVDGTKWNLVSMPVNIKLTGVFGVGLLKFTHDKEFISKQ